MKNKIVLTAATIAGVVAFVPAYASRYDQQARTQGSVNEPWFVKAEPPPQFAQARQQDQQPQSQAMQQGQQTEGQQLTSFEEIKEMSIQNAQGDDLGSIDKLIVDTQREKIAYVVVSTSGIWDFGGQTAIVPWNAFQIQSGGDRGERVLVLDMSQQDLMSAPRGDIGKVIDPEQARMIHKFYGVSPYWTEK